MIDDKIYINILLDFYENLLTKRQLEILDLYYRKDFSMNEIAEEFKISKSAVSDLVRRTIKQLHNYEHKLHNYQLFQKRLALYDQLAALNNPIIDVIVNKLKESE
ncbi:MAG: sigma factor-like helix-turn-helix DNA-binding protein [Erysipelotrichaceae bacterium]|nr:sigma factor-like helix-turn-helix DNA-binding protein [Erysipelotrichaceae bacterium]